MHEHVDAMAAPYSLFSAGGNDDLLGMMQRAKEDNSNQLGQLRSGFSQQSNTQCLGAPFLDKSAACCFDGTSAHQSIVIKCRRCLSCVK